MRWQNAGVPIVTTRAPAEISASFVRDRAFCRSSADRFNSPDRKQSRKAPNFSSLYVDQLLTAFCNMAFASYSSSFLSPAKIRYGPGFGFYIGGGGGSSGICDDANTSKTGAMNLMR